LILFYAAANTTSELPPVVRVDQVYPLLQTYDSYADYFSIVQPLLLLDAWESVCMAWISGLAWWCHNFQHA